MGRGGVSIVVVPSLNLVRSFLADYCRWYDGGDRESRGTCVDKLASHYSICVFCSLVKEKGVDSDFFFIRCVARDSAKAAIETKVASYKKWVWQLHMETLQVDVGKC